MAQDTKERVDATPISVGRLSAVATGIVLVLWLALGFVAHLQEKPNEFGDMFGAASSLFSGLAFAGIIVTIWIQSREFELQRLELRETRQALEGQEKQLAKQAATLLQQSVDDTFFRMLSMFRQMATTVRHPGEPEVGVDYWRRLVKAIAKDDAVIKAYIDPDAFDDAWTPIYRQWEPTLGPYFATLAELLAFLATQTGETAERLSRILRAQLPPHEQVLLFMHGLSPWGRMFLKGYVEEMHLFKYYSSDPMIPGQQVRHWYDAAAFT